MPTSSRREIAGDRTAVVIAHPGHELRIWHWLETVRPLVLVVTDGSGYSGIPRIGATERILQDVGAPRGVTFGVLRDRQLYEAVLAGDSGLFLSLAEKMAAEFVQRRVECVVGDAAEGQIMAHDLLREVRRTAVQMAQRKLGWQIEQFEYALESHPASHPVPVTDGVRLQRLNAETLARKLAVARGYDEIQTIVDANLATFGMDAFAVECLFPCVQDSLLADTADGKLPYEVHGEEQVRRGRYQQAIRYQTHVVPILESLNSTVRCAA